MTTQYINALHITPGDAPFIELCNHYLGYFPKSKFDSTVLHLTGFNDRQTRDQIHAEKNIFWELKENSLRLTLANIFRFYQLIKKEKFELVVCHSYESLIMACLVNILNPQFKIIGISYKNGEFSGMLMRSLIFVCRKRVRLLCALESIRQDICKNLRIMPTEFIQSSHFSLDYRKIRDGRLSRKDAKKRLNLNQGSFVFVVSHESDTDSDVITILTAFAYALDEIKQGVLVIFCDRKHERAIRKKAKELLIENAVILRHDRNNIFRYFRAFDAIIVTWNPDMMNVILLQAMVSGLTVIGNHTPANIEYTGKTGFLYDEGDANQLAYYMNFAYHLTVEEKQELKKKMLAHINANFTPQACRKKFQVQTMARKFLYAEVEKPFFIKSI